MSEIFNTFALAKTGLLSTPYSTIFTKVHIYTKWAVPAVCLYPDFK